MIVLDRKNLCFPSSVSVGGNHDDNILIGVIDIWPGKRAGTFYVDDCYMYVNPPDGDYGVVSPGSEICYEAQTRLNTAGNGFRTIEIDGYRSGVRVHPVFFKSSTTENMYVNAATACGPVTVKLPSSDKSLGLISRDFGWMVADLAHRWGRAKDEAAASDTCRIPVIFNPEDTIQVVDNSILVEKVRFMYPDMFLRASNLIRGLVLGLFRCLLLYGRYPTVLGKLHTYEYQQAAAIDYGDENWADELRELPLTEIAAFTEMAESLVSGYAEALQRFFNTIGSNENDR